MDVITIRKSQQTHLYYGTDEEKTDFLNISGFCVDSYGNLNKKYS